MEVSKWSLVLLSYRNLYIDITKKNKVQSYYSTEGLTTCGEVALRREGDFTDSGSNPPNSILDFQVETARGALCSQVLRSQGAAKAEENLTAKCPKYSFNPMSIRSRVWTLEHSADFGAECGIWSRVWTLRSRVRI